MLYVLVLELEVFCVLFVQDNLLSCKYLINFMYSRS